MYHYLFYERVLAKVPVWGKLRSVTPTGKVNAHYHVLAIRSKLYDVYCAIIKLFVITLEGAYIGISPTGFFLPSMACILNMIWLSSWHKIQNQCGLIRHEYRRILPMYKQITRMTISDIVFHASSLIPTGKYSESCKIWWILSRFYLIFYQCCSFFFFFFFFWGGGGGGGGWGGGGGGCVICVKLAATNPNKFDSGPCA